MAATADTPDSVASTRARRRAERGAGPSGRPSTAAEDDDPLFPSDGLDETDEWPQGFGAAGLGIP